MPKRKKVNKGSVGRPTVYRSTASSSTTSSTTTTNHSNNATTAPNSSSSSSSSVPERRAPDTSLVLTSEKRRGIYECDECHSDISQLPRIRCAVCPDYDLCLNCFVRAMESLPENKEQQDKNNNATTNHHHHHDEPVRHDHATHGYRVCDSTRYPLFPPGRPNPATTNSKTASSSNSKSNDTDVLATTTTPTTETTATDTTTTDTSTTTATNLDILVLPEDSKAIWTVEEDLRLLDAIKTHGLGNWVDISEAVSGNGSTGKTAKRCMERYFDDFLGRYGSILPPYTMVDDEIIATTDEDNSKTNSDNASNNTPPEEANQDSTRTSKRRHIVMRSSSGGNGAGSQSYAKKKVKVLSTDSLLPTTTAAAAVASSTDPTTTPLTTTYFHPYFPDVPGVQAGMEVNRDQASKAELAFVKAVANVTKEEADAIRQTWTKERLLQPAGPTVLPFRPEDIVHLPGSELAGYMPRRGDFDIEWENDAEKALADMEFLPNDPPQDRQLKLQVLQIYNGKLDEREKRKKFILSRNLHDYRNRQQTIKDKGGTTTDEWDLIRRMRLFERFLTPQEHERFIRDILHAKQLRKEIAKLQMYRRIGIQSLAEAEMYELDKTRRQFHKNAQLQKESTKSSSSTTTNANANNNTNNSNAGNQKLTGNNTSRAAGSLVEEQESISSSLWKQYKPSVRRRSTSYSNTDNNNKNKNNNNNNDHHGETNHATPALTTINGPKTTEESSTNKAPTSSIINGPKTPGEESSALDDDVKMVTEPQDIVSTTTTTATTTTTTTDDQRPGYQLLSKREISLCEKIKLEPMQYLDIKKILIRESLSGGLLGQKDPNRRTMVELDVERRGNVVDFMVRAGWISHKLGTAARNLAPSSSPLEPTE